MRPLPLPFVALLLVCLAACYGSPTEPKDHVLWGVYGGEIRAYPMGEDWSNIRLTVATNGDTVTGTLVANNGPSHPVTGHWVNGCYALTVNELPQHNPCWVYLTVNEVRAGSIRGDLSGRCPSTLMSKFQLQRMPNE